MKVIYCNGESHIDIDRLAGVGLGNFDGLHIGHMALINTLIAESRLYGLASVVYTFTKHPENIIRKKLFTPLLTTMNKKIELLDETMLDYICIDEFDEDFSRLSPETFVVEILIRRMGMKLAVSGFDYRFGYKGQGDSDTLKELGKLYNFKVVIIPPVKIDNEVISSTAIRNHVARGDMDRVFRLLGRHYSITGEVKNGRRIGSKIGFPTANIHPENYLVLPKNGVYITKTLFGGILYPSITNIGVKPTFNEKPPVSVETHILDFQKDIYSEKIEVFFISKVRDEKKFSGKDKLIEQIRMDVETARSFFGMNST